MTVKKYISIALVLLFFSLNYGYFYYFKYLQSDIHINIRERIKSNLSDKDLTLIVVGDNQKLNWTRVDQEFLYEGNIYDVVRTEVENGKKYIYCIKDTKERELINRFLGNNSHSKTFLAKEIKTIQKSLKQKIIEIGKSFVLQVIKFYYQKEYKQIFIDIILPPPRLV